MNNRLKQMEACAAEGSPIAVEGSILFFFQIRHAKAGGKRIDWGPVPL